MLFSIVLGVAISKFVRDRNITFLTAIVIGTLIGFLGALGVFGVVYPFYVAEVTDILWIPEVTLYSVFFIGPQVKVYLFEGAWLSSEMPINPVAVILFVVTNIVCVLVGQVAGRRWFWRNTI